MKDLKMRNLSGLAGFTVMRGAALVCVLSLVSMLGVIFWNAMPATGVYGSSLLTCSPWRRNHCRCI